MLQSSVKLCPKLSCWSGFPPPWWAFFLLCALDLSIYKSTTHFPPSCRPGKSQESTWHLYLGISEEIFKISQTQVRSFLPGPGFFQCTDLWTTSPSVQVYKSQAQVSFLPSRSLRPLKSNPLPSPAVQPLPQHPLNVSTPLPSPLLRQETKLFFLIWAAALTLSSSHHSCHFQIHSLHCSQSLSVSLHKSEGNASSWTHHVRALGIKTSAPTGLKRLSGI